MKHEKLIENNLMTNINTPYEEMMKDIDFFKRVEENLAN